MSTADRFRLLTALVLVLGFVLVLTGNLPAEAWVGLTVGAALPSPLTPPRP